VARLDLVDRLSPPRVVVLVGSVGLLATVAGSVLAWVSDDAWFDDLWFEVAKAGVQVFAVGVLGGALGAAWQHLARAEERRHATHERLRAEITETYQLYNGVKEVQRNLRSLGLDATSGVLTQAQVEGLRHELEKLNQLQLAFEMRKRSLARWDALGDDKERAAELLSGIESHLNSVLRTREKLESGRTTGSPVLPVSDSLQPLLRKIPFRAHVSGPVRELADLIDRAAQGSAPTGAPIPASGRANPSHR
jgi:hypothetical protein